MDRLDELKEQWPNYQWDCDKSTGAIYLRVDESCPWRLWHDTPAWWAAG